MKKLFLVGAILGLAFAPGLAGAVQPPDLHCEGHSSVLNTKVQANPDGSLDSIVLAAGTRFCVKGSTKESGLLIADGTTTLKVYLGSLNQNNQLQSVSYYVVYPPIVPPVTLEAFICFNGQITVLTNTVQAALNLAVSAYLEANPGAVQVESRTATCVAPTTTTTAPQTTTTTAPAVTTTTGAPVVTTTAPPVTAPPAPRTAPPAPPAPPAPAAPQPVDQLPRTGGSALLLILGSALGGLGMALRGTARLIRR